MQFQVLIPSSISELDAMLAGLDDKTQILAGGTDLLPRIKRGFKKPEKVLSLHRLTELRNLNYKPGDGLHIGALATHAQVAVHPDVRQKYSALAEACSGVASPQVRNLGTVAGNIANASPAADTAPVLLALRAEVFIRRAGGLRSIPLSDFFCGPGKTVLSPNEVIERIYIPEPLPGTLSIFLKLGRHKALECSICSVALAAVPKARRWHHVGLALGAVAPVPLLEGHTAAMLEGQTWTSDLISAAGQSAASASIPIDDIRASAGYRKAMIPMLVKKSAQQLLAKISHHAA